MDRRKIVRHNTQSSTETIPNDLIIEILLRLPSKSIATCRCVSKQWASLLRSQDFTDSFLTSSSTRPRLLFTFEFGGKWHFFSSPQPRNLDENLSDDVAADYHMGFSGDPYKEVSLSVNGFIYLIDRRMSKEKIGRVPVICNPSTGQRLVLPKVRARNNDLRSFFGYDPISKQFKVLCMTVTNYRQQITSKEHQVLTLGTGKGNLSWRKIECLFPHFPARKNDVICINGVLYYTAWTDKSSSDLIALFDVWSEEFRFIETEKLSKLHYVMNLINYKGKLGVLMHSYGSNGELWVLDDIEKEMWSKHVFALPTSAFHTGNSIWATDTGEIGWAPNHLTNPFYVSYYNLERKSLRIVEIKGIKEKLFMDTGDHPQVLFTDHVENVMFL